jgi:hypothetical protein
VLSAWRDWRIPRTASSTIVGTPEQIRKQYHPSVNAGTVTVWARHGAGTTCFDRQKAVWRESLLDNGTTHTQTSHYDDLRLCQEDRRWRCTWFLRQNC